MSDKLEAALATLTPEELQHLDSDPTLLAEFKAKYGEEKKSLIKRAWDALAVPEKMSREGLLQIAEATPGREPTGNMLLDVGLNIPKVAAETMAEAAPSFVSRGTILTAGGLRTAKAAAPVARSLGGAAARFGESISGLEYKTPGILGEVAQKPGILFAKGREGASKMYQAAMDYKNVRPEMSGAMTHADLIEKAKEALAAGTLNADEALAARQSLDAVKKSMPRGNFVQMRDAFDKVAKTASAEADAAYATGIKADAIRQLAPVNKTGGASIPKMFLGSLAGVAPALAMTPLVQGGMAAGAGAAYRGAAALAQAPIPTGATFNAIIDYFNRRNRPSTPLQGALNAAGAYK